MNNFCHKPVEAQEDDRQDKFFLKQTVPKRHCCVFFDGCLLQTTHDLPRRAENINKGVLVCVSNQKITKIKGVSNEIKGVSNY